MMKVSDTKYLRRVNSPSDLKRLKESELADYCAELRDYMIAELAINPGHFGSSLGAVEVAVAVHYVYDVPDDSLVWDVGHQAYAHKIITGRRDAFPTNRKLGGISGFPRRSESPFDSFGGGHSSSSISAALGMAVAARIEGRASKTVAIIGDGAMSGGLAFEGLNNAGGEQADLLVILNDNQHSIDPNVGALKEYFLELTTSRWYNRFKVRVWNFLGFSPRLRRTIQKVESGAKSFFLHRSNIFESLGFRYFGPADGNDIKTLVRTLRDLKEIGGAKLLHLYTVKGKGFSHAEEHATTWHAPGVFDPETGERLPASDKLRFQDIFGHSLVELARGNDKIVGITPAMPSGCSLNVMMEAMPHRAFDVGIAEGHAVTFAAGLAAAGMLPYCNIYSSFSQRAVDNIIHDVALQGLEVVMCLDRGGLVGEDGATHHGFFDMALLRCVPNIIIVAPADASELRNALYTASLGGYGGCFVIRYPRGGSFSRSVLEEPFVRIEGMRLITRGERVAIISVGDTFAEASAAAASTGASHYDLRFVKPLDTATLDYIAANHSHVVTIENGVAAGGAGSAILEYYSSVGSSVKVDIMGIGDNFTEHGTVAELRGIEGLTAAGIELRITNYDINKK